MKDTFRSPCPINSSLEIVGDKWSLIIMRDILMFGKKTFKDFNTSDEKIATNILTNRLVDLEKRGIITKEKSPTNKKVNIYKSTKIGIDLLPIIMEMGFWAYKHRMHFECTIPEDTIKQVDSLMKNKEEYIKHKQKELLESLEQEAII